MMGNNNNRQVAVKQQADTVRSALEKLKPQLAMALPKHLTADRLLRVTMTAVQQTPKLLECDRTSLFAAVLTCAQLGLEPDGVLGQAYLVPFRSKGIMKVQFIPGYKGYLTLARNSGEVSTIQAHEVCENDDFDYNYGLNETLHHKPAEGERGEITHFYAYAKFKDGGHVFEVMTRAQVEAIRDDSEGFKAFKAGYIKSTPWDSHYPQMGRKTAIRRLANYLPMSVQRAAALDAAYDEGKHGHTDDYGDLVIEGEAEQVNGENGNGAASSKLDALAGDEGGEAEPESSKEAAKATKRKAGAKKGGDKEPDEPPQKPARFAVQDGDVIDNETGEVVPAKYVKWFEDGTFSVLKGYGQQTPTDDEPALFGAES